MRVLGLAVEVPPKKKLTVRAVLLTADPANLVPGEVSGFVWSADFTTVATETDLASQLKELSDAARGRIQSLGPERVIIRRADRPSRPNNYDGPRFRLLAEGALTVASKAEVLDTRLQMGKDCATDFGTSRDVLEERARELAGARPAYWVGATAAAIAGLHAK